MWIIPKPLHTSLSAPATEALILDSQELSEQCAQSLLVRSTPSPVRTWSRKWNRDSWTSHLSGRILKPSLGNSFAAQWTSSLEASLVSHLAPLDDAQATTTQDTSGHTSLEASSNLDGLPLFSSRTSKASSQASSTAINGATQQGRLFCSMSSANWKGWVIKQRRAYSVRERLAPPIDANVSLSSAQTSTTQGETSSTACSTTWPTPKATEINETPDQRRKRRARPSAKNMGPSLTVAAKIADSTEQRPRDLWSTPLASNQRGPASRDYTECLHFQASQREQPTLHQEAPINTTGSHQESLWTATDSSSTTAPTSSDCSETVSSQTPPLVPLESFGKSWSTPDQAHGGTYRGKLNPRWVETLMGLPVGWVRPSATDIDNDND